jgi:hypothetical protein
MFTLVFAPLDAVSLMGIDYLVMTLAALLALCLLLLGPIPLRYFRFRGVRIVQCPETKEFAAVKVNAGRCAFDGMLVDPVLRLSSCSRWPERQGCGEECLSQIESAPGDCLLRNILAKWYRGKRCVYCNKEFEELHWPENKPALLSPDGRTVEWRDMAPEVVPATLRTHAPVCWNCHISMTFRSEHPELVVDRPWRKNEFGEIQCRTPGDFTHNNA